MRTVTTWTAGVALVALLAAPARCQNQPPTPHTLWSFLGIPPGSLHKVKDHVLAHLGTHHPHLEPKPPLKPIADPANLEAKTPAVKAAAAIKQQEDAAAQKIKAINYLATIGCGLHDADGTISDALRAALSDPTEKVRLAAVEAIASSAKKETCSRCKSHSCCSPEMVKKLREISSERDENGCWKEPSARVRRGARLALNACAPVEEPPQPKQKEVPEEKEKELPPPNEPSKTADMQSLAPAPSKESLDISAEPIAASPMTQPTVSEAGPGDSQQSKVASDTNPNSKQVVPSQAQVLWSPNRPELAEQCQTLPACKDPLLVNTLPSVHHDPFDEPSRNLDTRLSGGSKQAHEARTPAKEVASSAQLNASASNSNHEITKESAHLEWGLKWKNMAASDTTVPAGLDSSDAKEPSPSAAPHDQPAEASREPAVDDQQPTKLPDKVSSRTKSLPRKSSAKRELGRLAGPTERPRHRVRRDSKIRGTVHKVDTTRGTVHVRFDNDVALPPGTRAKVYQQYLFGESLGGDLAVVQSAAGDTTFEPLGRTRLSKIRRGNLVVISGID